MDNNLDYNSEEYNNEVLKAIQVIDATELGFDTIDIGLDHIDHACMVDDFIGIAGFSEEDARIAASNVQNYDNMF